MQSIEVLMGVREMKTYPIYLVINTAIYIIVQIYGNIDHTMYCYIHIRLLEKSLSNY